MGIYDIFLNENSVYNYLFKYQLFLKNKIFTIMYINVSTKITLLFWEVDRQFSNEIYACYIQSSRIIFNLEEAAQYSYLGLGGIHSCHYSSVNMEFGVMKL